VKPAGSAAATGSWDFALSYARSDLAWAKWIAWHLEKVGYRVHFPDRHTVPGNHLVAAEDEVARATERTLVVLSRDYLDSASDGVRWHAAMHADPDGAKRRLVPVRVQDFDAGGLLGGVVPIDIVGLSALEAEAALTAGTRAAVDGRWARPSVPPAFPAEAAAGPVPRYPGRTSAEVAEGFPVVVVHGEGEEFPDADVAQSAWFPALAEGVLCAGGSVAVGEVGSAFYGDLFRGRARLLGVGDVEPLTLEEAKGLAYPLYAAAAEVDPEVPPPGIETLGTPRSVQFALRALLNSRTFGGWTIRRLTGSFRQVRQYLTDEEVRRDILDRVEQAVGPATRVLIGHSLGSVAAYEALLERTDWRVTHFVTLGSPLGLPFVRDRLAPSFGRPTAATGPWLPWPGAAAARGQGSVTTWRNFAGVGDVVALEKDLRRYFLGPVRSDELRTGRRAHEAVSYLASRDVGKAISEGLSRD
jgi:TIR domain